MHTKKFFGIFLFAKTTFVLLTRSQMAKETACLLPVLQKGHQNQHRQQKFQKFFLRSP